MSEYSWLHYRLEVVSRWPDSPCKIASLAAIEARLKALPA